MLFSIVAAPVYIPTNSVEGSPLLQSSPILGVSCLFESSHLNRCEVLTCLPLMISDVKHLYISVDRLNLFFEKMSIQVLHLFLN